MVIQLIKRLRGPLTEATLALTYSVTFDLKQTSYQQVLPSFAYPPALLKIFSKEQISEMFKHIGETYLSKKYQETRDWYGFVNQRTTETSISHWMTEILKVNGMHVPTQLELLTAKQAISRLHDLFNERLEEGENRSCENLAKQVVYFIVLACLESFPGFFKSLNLPRTAEDLDQITSYEMAVKVFGRWQSEKEFEDELTVITRSILADWKRNLLQFCAQAILYMFNIQFRHKYVQLFISSGTMEGKPKINYNNK